MQQQQNANSATAAYMCNGDSLVLLLGSNGLPNGPTQGLLEGGSSSSGCSNHSATELSSPVVNGLFETNTSSTANGYSLPQLTQLQPSQKQSNNSTEMFDVSFKIIGYLKL